LIGDYFFIPPKGSILHYENLLAESRVLALALTGTLVSILSELTRKAIKARFEILERFAILVDSFTDYAIFTTDPQGRITYWNAGAERIVGYSQREIIGSGLSIFYAPEDAVSGKPGLELETARSTGHCEQEGWQTRKDGSRF